jgi:LAGLIDADG endonuclease
MLEELDIAYIAGLFDGEGSINIFRKKNKSGSFSYYLEITITNTDFPVLSWLQSVLGGRVDKTSNIKLQGSRPLRRWRASCRDAHRILLTLLPYLRVKKTQAELAIEFQSTVALKVKGQKSSLDEITLLELYRTRLIDSRKHIA